MAPLPAAPPVRSRAGGTAPFAGALALGLAAAVVGCSSDHTVGFRAGMQGAGGSDGGTGRGGGSGGVISLACDAASPCPKDQACVKTDQGGTCEPRGNPCNSNEDCT